MKELEGFKMYIHWIFCLLIIAIINSRDGSSITLLLSVLFYVLVGHPSTFKFLYNLRKVNKSEMR